MDDEEMQCIFAGLGDPGAAAPFSAADLVLVEAALAGEIPTDPGEVDELRTTLFRVSRSSEVAPATRDVLAEPALRLGEIANQYQLAKSTRDRALKTLEKLDALMSERDDCLDTFQALNQQKMDALSEEGDISGRIAAVEGEIASLRLELTALTSQHSAAASRVATANEAITALFQRSVVLSPQLDSLLPLRPGLEADLGTRSSRSPYHCSITPGEAMLSGVGSASGKEVPTPEPCPVMDPFSKGLEILGTAVEVVTDEVILTSIEAAVTDVVQNAAAAGMV